MDQGISDVTGDRARLAAWVRDRTWFYTFELPDGSRTQTNTTAEVQRFHGARRSAMIAVLESRFASRLRTIDCIDLGSHEGWFAIELARRTRTLRGFDVKPASIEAARRMCQLQEVENVAFTLTDFRDIDPNRVTPADFVLLYGLLYHAEDPLRILRLAASLARDTLLIETQVTAWEFGGAVEWGASEGRKPVLGWFALIDDDDNREGGNTGIALVPSIEAVRQSLLRMGFARVEHVRDFDAETEQLRRGQRAVIAAYR